MQAASDRRVSSRAGQGRVPIDAAEVDGPM